MDSYTIDNIRTKLDMDELVIAAYTEELPPVIVVEGIDDEKFYDKLLHIAGGRANIYPVELIEGCGEGCESVINLFERIQDFFEAYDDSKEYILGIIDKDSRTYTGKLPSLDGVFILSYYSYESHYITDNVLREIISKSTKIIPSKVTDKILGFVKSELDKLYEELMYLSLEALKKKCIHGYDSIVNYDISEWKIANYDSRQYYISQIESKKDDLNTFAYSKDIDINSFEHLRSVCKGKWLLASYSSSILMNIKQLEAACSSNQIDNCQFFLGGHSKCSYKLKKRNYQMTDIYEDIKEIIDFDEINYIVVRLKSLKLKNSV
jgi:hypothetical protein